MRSNDTCRSCGAPIRWAVSATTSNRMPLNSEADIHGNIAVVEWGPREPGRGSLSVPIVAVNVAAGTPTETPFRYTSHFATCVNAASHRRRK